MKAHGLLLGAAALIMAISGCKKDSDVTSPTPPTDKITVGTRVDAGSAAITPSGGTVTVSAPGASIDGMTITVPPNAISSSRTFTISYAPITAHNFGANFHPITPLIRISNGGGYADSGMIVRIPVKIAEDEVAAAFFYNERTKTLEPLPVIDEDSVSITVGTMHFDPNNISSTGAQSGGGHSTQGWDAWANMVVSSIVRSALDGIPVISSGFVPGIDDWEFTNYGSFIAPGGNCAGQSMTAMWYYYEQKLAGKRQLYRQFDRVQSSQDVLWQDNPRGYRWASTIQCDFNFTGWQIELIRQSRNHKAIFYTFALGMLLCGEPLSVLMASTTSGGGHAMVVYAVEPSAGKLRIADPNYPGDKTMFIPYANNRLGPYQGKLRAGAPDVNFDLIGAYGKTAYIRWDQIGNRYTEFQNGTIGGDRYPRYKFFAASEGGIEIHDTVRTSASSIAFTIASDPPGSIPGLQFSKYNDAGVVLPAGAVPLKFGWNQIGIYVEAHPTPTATDFRWLDFRWIAVNRNPFKIESTRPDGIPVTTAGQMFTAYTLKCNGYGETPANSKYVWDFGDGSAMETKTNDSTVAHTYSKKGTFTTKLEVWDNATATKLADVNQDIVITDLVELTGTFDSSRTIIGAMKMKFNCVWTVKGLGTAIEMNTRSGAKLAVKPGAPMHAELLFSVVGDPEPFIVEYPADGQKHVYTLEDVRIDTTVYVMGKFPRTISRDPFKWTMDATFSEAAQSIWMQSHVFYTLVRKDYFNGDLYNTSRAVNNEYFFNFTVISRQ